MSNRPSRTPSASAKVRAASHADRPRSTAWLWGALVALVVVVGVVAVVVGRSDDGSSSTGSSASPSGGTVVPSGDVQYGTVSVQGTPLPDAPADAGTADTAVGQTIPTIEGQTFDGSSLQIAPTGTPQLIMVVAHWCPHCQAEVPRIQKWLDDNGMPTDVQLTTLATANTDTRTNFPAGPWLVKEGWSVPTIVDDQANDGGAALGVTGFPFFVVVDAEGRVVQRTSGEITMDQFSALLDAARTGQPAGS